MQSRQTPQTAKPQQLTKFSASRSMCMRTRCIWSRTIAVEACRAMPGADGMLRICTTSLCRHLISDSLAQTLIYQCSLFCAVLPSLWWSASAPSSMTQACAMLNVRAVSTAIYFNEHLLQSDSMTIRHPCLCSILPPCAFYGSIPIADTPWLDTLREQRANHVHSAHRCDHFSCLGMLS